MEDNKKPKGISFKGISQWRLAIVVVILAFVYLFYGNSDGTLRRQRYVKSQIKKCDRDIDSLNRRIDHYQDVLKKIESDDAFLEEFAREKYYMTGPNEDIIVIEKK